VVQKNCTSLIHHTEAAVKDKLKLRSHFHESAAVATTSVDVIAKDPGTASL